MIRLRVLIVEEIAGLEANQLWYALSELPKEKLKKMPWLARYKKRVIVTCPRELEAFSGCVVEVLPHQDSAANLALVAVKRINDFCATITKINGISGIQVDSPIVLSIDFYNSQARGAFVGWSPEVGYVTIACFHEQIKKAASVFHAYKSQLIYRLNPTDCFEGCLRERTGIIWSVMQITELSHDEEEAAARQIENAQLQPPLDDPYHFFLLNAPLWGKAIKPKGPKFEIEFATNLSPVANLALHGSTEATLPNHDIRVFLQARLSELDKVICIGILVNPTTVYTSEGLLKIRVPDFANFGVFVQVRGIEGPKHGGSRTTQRKVDWVDTVAALVDDLPIRKHLFDIQIRKTALKKNPDIYLATIFLLNTLARRLIPLCPLFAEETLEIADAVVPIELKLTNEDTVVADLYFDEEMGSWQVVAIKKFEHQPCVKVTCLDRVSSSTKKICYSMWRPLRGRPIQLTGWVVALRTKGVFIWPCMLGTNWSGLVILNRNLAPPLAFLGDYVSLMVIPVRCTAREDDPIGISLMGVEVLKWTFGYELHTWGLPLRKINETLGEVTVWHEFVNIMDAGDYWRPVSLLPERRGYCITDAEFGLKVYCPEQAWDEINNKLQVLAFHRKLIGRFRLPCVLSAEPIRDEPFALRIDVRVSLEKAILDSAEQQNLTTNFEHMNPFRV